MKFLSKFIVLVLLSGCSYLDNQPEVSSRYVFPEGFQGYYKLDSNDTTLYVLKEEFKISEDYITFKNKYYSNDDDRYTSYQIYYVYSYSGDNGFYFDVYSAYENQDNIYGRFSFTDNGDGTVDVIYYHYASSYRDIATYKKSNTPF